MKNISFVILGLLTSIFCTIPSAQALVKIGPVEKTEIKGIALASSAQLDDQPAKLKRVTQGLRQKKVVFAWFSVYVAQFFSKQEGDFKSVTALKESFLKGLPVVVTMTFVRDVEIGKIVEGFKEVFKANGVDAEKAPFKEYIEAVAQTGEVKDRQVFSFAFTENKGGESVRFETRGKEWFQIKDQPAGTISKFLAMWLGTPVDSGLEQLQEQILKP